MQARFGYINGKVCWVKKDGTAARKNVLLMKEVEFRGLKLPCSRERGKCSSLKILLGVASTDDRLIVYASVGPKGACYLLKRGAAPIQIASNAQSLIDSLGRRQVRTTCYRDWRLSCFQTQHQRNQMLADFPSHQ